MSNANVRLGEGLFSAHDLSERQFDPLQFIVNGLIPVGLTVLAGAPKAGKSWLSLDIALAVAKGTAVLDEALYRCPKGAVLYLALEDSDRRLQDRLTQMLGTGPAWPANLFFETTWPRMDADGLERLDHWAAATDAARLIIIDVFHKVRAATGAQASYERDYADLTALQKLARDREIGILLIHHLRKSGGDPFERMTGSTGLQGAADTLIVLDKGRGTTRLLARGRDIEETERELAFDKTAMRWRLSHSRAAARHYPERDRIKSLLAQHSTPLSAGEIARATGQTDDAVRQLLRSMVADGEIAWVSRGRYAARQTAHLLAANGNQIDHNDHDHHDAPGHEEHERCPSEDVLNRRDADLQASADADPAGVEVAADTFDTVLDWLAQLKSGSAR